MIRDGDWILHNYDYHTGKTVWKYEHGDGRVTFRTDEPVSEIVNQNAVLRNDTAGEKFGDWRMVARVPAAMYFDQLLDAQNQLDGKYVDRWLDEHSAFKTFR